MNEDDLLALADKLYGKGLSDHEVDEHLRRALMGQGEESSVSGPEAFGMGLASSTAGDPSADVEPEAKGRMAASFAPKSNIGAGVRGAIEEQVATSEAAQNERPGTHFLGAITPSVLELGGTAVQSGPALMRGAQRLGRTAKEYAGATKLGRAFQRAGRITEDPIARAIAGAGKTEAPAADALTQGARARVQPSRPFVPPKGGGKAQIAQRIAQTAGPSNASPMGAQEIKLSVKLARQLGQSDEMIAQEMARRGLTRLEIANALGVK